MKITALFLSVIMIAIIIKKNARFLPIIVIFWSGLMLYILFFSRILNEPNKAKPIFTICYGFRQFWKYRNIQSTWKYHYLEEISINLCLFIPVGMLLPIAFKSVKLGHVIVGTFLASLIIELIQHVTGLGVFDVNDLLNNAIGAFWGWVLFKWLFKQNNGQDNDRNFE